MGPVVEHPLLRDEVGEAEPDQITTSKSPSSIRASGATCIPPPKKRPLHTESEVIRSSLHAPPSARQRTGWSDQQRSACARREHEGQPPARGACSPRFTSRATTPEMPNPATFAKWRTWRAPVVAGELDAPEIADARRGARERARRAVEVLAAARACAGDRRRSRAG